LSVLITTRDLRTLPSGAPVVTVEEMAQAEAQRMLLRGLDLAVVAPQETALGALAEQRFGRWPLLLQLGNGYIMHRLNTGEPLAQILQDLNEALSEDGLDETMAFEAAGDVRRRLQPTLDLSIALLRPEDATLYRQLAVFSLEDYATVGSAARLWGVSPAPARTLCSHLNTLSLLRHYQGGTGTLQLHMAVRDVLAEVLGKKALTRLHQYVAEAWRAACGADWRELRDDYALRHLLRHLAEAGQAEAVRDLLLDAGWMVAKLRGTGVQALLGDYRQYAGPPDGAAGLVGRALDLAAGPLAAAPEELPGQIIGRLAAEDAPGLSGTLNVMRTMASPETLLPLRPSLTPPGAELRRRRPYGVGNFRRGAAGRAHRIRFRGQDGAGLGCGGRARIAPPRRPYRRGEFCRSVARRARRLRLFGQHGAGLGCCQRAGDAPPRRPYGLGDFRRGVAGRAHRLRPFGQNGAGLGRCPRAGDAPP
jgi:hypothetical protein